MAQNPFPLGTLVATPLALKALEQAKTSPEAILDRHVAGDWGDLCAEDRQLNDAALEGGSRILSAYILSTGEKIWVITEADRSATCLLVPEEY